jgi:hypothetical protein
MMELPDDRLPEELWDPRFNPQAFAALTPQCRYSTIHLHVETVMAAFNAPLDEAGVANMERLADDIRQCVYDVLSAFLEEDQVEYAANCCEIQAVVNAVREHFLVRDFTENGLSLGNGYAWTFFAGCDKGWAKWCPFGSASWRGLASIVTGIIF